MPESPMILREAFDYEFSTLDPFGAHIDPPSVAVYETLIAKGPDGKAHPALARSWDVSADRLEWRVHLRPELRFHSGATCDAPAIVAALSTLRRTANAVRQLWYWDPVDELRADGSDTLVFTLHYPYARLPALLWGTHTAAYNEALRSRDLTAFGRQVADGTGPFQMVSWSPERIVGQRWSSYPGIPATFVDNHGSANQASIEWNSILDERERLTALEDGRVHCLHGPPLADVDALRRDPRFVVVEHGQASNVYLGLNWQRSDLGFDDLLVRRAFSLALDRSKLVTLALFGHGAPTYGPLPPGDEFYDPNIDEGRHPDPLLAARLLDEAGWRRGTDGVRERGGQELAFECVNQDDAVLRRVGVGVRDQLAELGIRLKLRFVKPFQEFYDACQVGTASFISKWLWQDPMDAIIGFSSTSTIPFPNWQHSSIPALDAAFEAWLRAGTLEELQTAASRAQQIVAEQLPYIPLLTPNDVWVQTSKLHGWRPFPANLYPFYQDAWLEGETVNR